MTEHEFMKWAWADTGKMALQAVAIYAVALGAYWIVVA